MMSIIDEGFKQTDFSTAARIQAHNMVEFKKEEVELCVLYHLVAREFNIRWH